MFADTILSGSFTTPSSGNANQTVVLPFIPDLFEVWVRGNSSGNNWTAATAAVKYAFWQSGMSAGTALVYANNPLVPAFLSSGGITSVTSVANSYGASVAGTAITNAAPPVVTTTPSNPWASGSIVQFEQTVAAYQLSLFPWSVTQLTSTTYQLGDPSGGFSAPGSAATSLIGKQILFPNVFTPYVSYIVGMTLGSTTTVYTSFPHGLSVSDTVRLVIPSGWGPTQISGQQGQITSVPDAWSFVININSSAASAFAFPTSAIAAAGISVPQVIPFGDTGTTFDISSTDNNYQGIIIGNSSTVGSAILNANSALVLWRAQKSAKVYTSLTY